MNYISKSVKYVQTLIISSVVKNVERKAKKRDNSNNKYQEYLINVKTKTFHLGEDCSSIRNIESKYIQETKAYEKDIIVYGKIICRKMAKKNVVFPTYFLYHNSMV